MTSCVVLVVAVVFVQVASAILTVNAVTGQELNRQLYPCLNALVNDCPDLSEIFGMRVTNWHDSTSWKVPRAGEDVVIPANSLIFVSSCSIDTKLEFGTITFKEGARLVVSSAVVRFQAREVVGGEVETVNRDLCLRRNNARSLAGNPTKQPTQQVTKRPTNQPTDQPTENEGTNPPGSGGAGDGGFVLNGTNDNDAQAVATLVGSTVPFVGIGGIALGVYMVRKRRSSSLRKNELDASVLGGLQAKHASTSNPAFNGAAALQSQDPFPMKSFPRDSYPMTSHKTAAAEAGVLPSIFKFENKATDEEEVEDAGNRSSKRKTMSSLMAMVVKSRETASFYKSPVEGMDVESGMSKEQIEEKIKRQAALGAIGYGTTTSGVGLKGLGSRLSKMRPEGRESIKPSEVVLRESASVAIPAAPRTTASVAVNRSMPSFVPSAFKSSTRISTPATVEEEKEDIPPPPPLPSLKIASPPPGFAAGFSTSPDSPTPPPNFD